MSTVEHAPQETTSPETNRPYGFSVLASACSRWWRGTWTLLITIIVNAIIQTALVLGNPVAGSSAILPLLAVLSFIVLLLAACAVVNVALLTVAGRTSFGTALARMRTHFWLFCAWSILWAIIVNVGLMFHTWPGILIAAITPFVCIAAADGRPNAIGANFRAIGSRFGRYLATLILTGIILLVFHLLATADSFFIGGPLSAFILWVGLGLVGSWLIVGWALLYRATTVGHAPFATVDTGDPAVR